MLRNIYASDSYELSSIIPRSSFRETLVPREFRPWTNNLSKEDYWQRVDNNCIFYMSQDMCDHYIVFLYGSKNPLENWPRSDPTDFNRVSIIIIYSK